MSFNHLLWYCGGNRGHRWHGAAGGDAASRHGGVYGPEVNRGRRSISSGLRGGGGTAQGGHDVREADRADEQTDEITERVVGLGGGVYCRCHRQGTAQCCVSFLVVDCGSTLSAPAFAAMVLHPNTPLPHLAVTRHVRTPLCLN